MKFFDENIIKIETQNVNVKTLDSFVSHEKIKNINILYLDVQGSEYDILMGARKTIKSKKIDIIILEYNFHKFYSNDRSSQDVHSFLQRQEYVFVDFVGKKYAQRDLRFLAWADAVFIRKEIC